MAMPKGRVFLLSPLILALSGCAFWPVGSSNHDAPVQRIAGLLERGEQHWTIRACDQQQSRLLQPTEELQRLVADIAQQDHVAVFAELAVSQENDRWLVKKTYRVKSADRGCMESEGANSQWVGFSRAEKWRVDITAQGMRLTTDDGEDGRQISIVSEQMPNGVLGFRGVYDQGLELWLYPTDCVDRSTGDYYHLSSVLVRDGQRLQGCGYQGGSAQF